MVLAPLPVVAIWFGGPWLALLTGIAGAIMAWEWVRLCRGALTDRFAPGPAEIGLVAIVVAAVAIAALGAVREGIAVAFSGAGLVFWAARQARMANPHGRRSATLWVALPCVCLLWLARDEAGGRATLLWMMAVVWATDIGAYAVGRGVGGPRLAPRWSPRQDLVRVRRRHAVRRARRLVPAR